MKKNNIGYESAVCIANFLQNNQTLKELNIGLNKITDTGASVIAEALNNNKTLTHLNFRHNEVGNLGAIKFAEALKNNQTLHYLNLESNTIEPVGISAIARALKDGNTTLEHLNLALNKAGITGGDTIVEALQSNKTLLHLNLRLTQISSEIAVKIIKTLINNNSLIYLDLGSNEITPQAAKEIAEVLANNKTLRCLELGLTKLTDQGAIHIAKALESNKTLVNLNLSNNKITAMGAKAIEKALEVNHTLAEINLIANEIKEENINSELVDSANSAPSNLFTKNALEKNIYSKIEYNRGLIKEFASLVVDYFFGNNKNIDNNFQVLTNKKFYDRADKKFLKSYLQEKKLDSDSVLQQLDKFFSLNLFTLNGICKIVQPDSHFPPLLDSRNKYVGHISELSSELLSHITSYLKQEEWGLSYALKQNYITFHTNNPINTEDYSLTGEESGQGLDVIQIN